MYKGGGRWRIVTKIDGLVAESSNYCVDPMFEFSRYMFSPVAFLMRCDVVQRIPHIETWLNGTKWHFMWNAWSKHHLYERRWVGSCKEHNCREADYISLILPKLICRWIKCRFVALAFILFAAIAVGLIMIQVKWNLLLALNSLNSQLLWYVWDSCLSCAFTSCNVMPWTLCSYTESENNMTAHGQEWLKEFRGVALLHSMN